MTSIRDFEQVTKSLNIYPDELGAVMLDFEPITDEHASIIPFAWEYYSPKQEEWWIKGFVGEKAHLTLRYGLLQKASQLKKQIDVLTSGIELPSVQVNDAEAFLDTNNPYAAIVLKLEEDDTLLELHRRLSYLPHIDTFTPWVPHVTLAYVHKEYATQAVRRVKKAFYGRWLDARGLNLGEDKY